MDEIEDANNDIDYNKPFCIGSNKEKFNFNIFSTPLNFLFDIFQGKTTLKKAEINQNNLKQKYRKLNITINQKMKKKKEKQMDIDACK